MVGQTQKSLLVTGPLDGSLCLLLHNRPPAQGCQASGAITAYEHLLSPLHATQRLLGRSLHLHLHLHRHFHPHLLLTTTHTRRPPAQLPRLRTAISGTVEYIQCEQVEITSFLAVSGRDGSDDGILGMDWVHTHHRGSCAQCQDQSIRLREEALQRNHTLILIFHIYSSHYYRVIYMGG